MKKERLLILDTETTGLNYQEDRIIEIGIVELYENILTGHNFHKYINPQKEISLSAQRVHGISNEFLLNKPVFSEIAQSFLDFIRDDVIIIHNAEFDIGFINKELKNCGFNDVKNQIIDTIKIAKKEFPGQTVNLDSLCKKLNIINTRDDYHGALLDANLLSKVYLKLTTGKQEDLDLRDNNITSFNNHNFNEQIEKHFFTPRSKLMSLTNHDREEHEKFINTMNDSIWKKIE